MLLKHCRRECLAMVPPDSLKKNGGEETYPDKVFKIPDGGLRPVNLVLRLGPPNTVALGIYLSVLLSFLE